VQQIPHYSDYLAADDGTIYSTKRTPNTVCKVTSETADSPPRVQIRRDGSSGNHYVPVAVLVASAYLGDQPEELSVMHLDGDLRNCRPDNVAWVNPADPAAWIDGTASVPGFPGYFAHESGAIFSCRRGRVVRSLQLVVTSSGDDVSVVMFDAGGKERLVRASLAVCSAFWGDLNGTVVYADGDRGNLTSDNLSWAQGSEDLKRVPDRARPVPGFPGYFIDEHATVYTTVAGSMREGSVFRLTPSLDLADYWCVTLRQNGIQKRKRIHVLVAMAFHGVKKNAALMARHLDDDRDNNHYSNIAWGTHEENMADRDRNGTTARGPHLSRLSDDDIREIRRRCDAGEKHHLVAHSYRLRGSAVANIAARKTFQNVM
jgi:hypothetical protein